MLRKRIEKNIIPFFAFICLIALILWFLYDPVKGLTYNVPGMDNRLVRETG